MWATSAILLKKKSSEWRKTLPEPRPLPHQPIRNKHSFITRVNVRKPPDLLIHARPDVIETIWCLSPSAWKYNKIHKSTVTTAMKFTIKKKIKKKARVKKMMCYHAWPHQPHTHTQTHTHTQNTPSCSLSLTDTHILTTGIPESLYLKFTLGMFFIFSI